MNMTNFNLILAILSMAYSSRAFTVSVVGRSALSSRLMVSTGQSANEMYFVDERDESKTSDSAKVQLEQQQQRAPVASAPTTTEQKKKPAPKPKNPAHKEGVFSPVVQVAKNVIGDDELNKIRGKVIAKHSDVIKGFVDTADSRIGQSVLKQLFALADVDKSGTIDEAELEQAFKVLGFTFLKEKQIKGIFARADLNEDGSIDLDEFLKEAPTTLRTNLVKLAKKNGGDMGLLV